MAAKKTAGKDNTIQIKRLETETVLIKLVGDTDLVLNKMTASTTREMTADDRKKAHSEESQKDPYHLEWESRCTSLHWEKPIGNIPFEDYTEELFYELLEKNAPCISAHGLKESWKSAVVRMGVDQYSTRFSFQTNIRKELLPITFAQYELDVKPMPQKGLGGGMLTAKLHRFIGWECIVPVSFIKGGVYTPDMIFSIIENAGFGLGIGSGCSSGYGRYHISAANG